MKRFCKKSISFALVLAMVFSLLTGSANVFAKTLDHGEIVILYTNDVHNGVNQVKNQNGYVSNLGYAGIASYKKMMEKQYGKNYVTLVDAGDAVQGEAIGTLSKGQYLVDIMNKVGYDIFVPGNHEFDYGMDRMLELMKKLDAKVISSNFTDLNQISLFINRIQWSPMEKVPLQQRLLL